MIDKSTIIELHSALISLRDNGPTYPLDGLCVNLVTQTTGDSEMLLIHLISEWPEHSGDRLYPVKGTIVSAEFAYRHSYFKWNRILPYGRRRHRLLNWLIDRCEMMIDNYEAP